MILYIFQNCTYFDKKKILREIYEDTQKLEQGVLRKPKIWDRVSLGNLARVSNLWPGVITLLQTLMQALVRSDHHHQKHRHKNDELHITTKLQSCRRTFLFFSFLSFFLAGPIPMS